MSAVIILIAAITIITASSHIHFSPLPSLHPPMTAGHHTEFPLDNTHTYIYIDTYTTMAQLFNLYIQSANYDYSFILSPFSLHHPFTSTDFSHSHSHMFHSLFSPCHRTLPPIKIYRRCLPTPLEHSHQYKSMLANYILKLAFQHHSNIPSLKTRQFPPSPLEHQHRHHWNMGNSTQSPENHPSTPPMHSSTPEFDSITPSPEES